MTEFLELLNKIDYILPQLGEFVNQFQTTISNNNINVIIEGAGDFSIDVPKDMPDSEAKKFSDRLRILDQLIRTRTEDVEELLNKSKSLLTNINEKEYSSKILAKVDELNKIKGKYSFYV